MKFSLTNGKTVLDFKIALLLSVAAFTLTGCPVYDPPYSGGGLYIENTSGQPIYVCLSCQDSLSIYPPLVAYSFWGNATDEYGKPKTDTIFPYYRVKRNEGHFIPFYGSKKRSTSNCADKKWRIFLISEKNMRERPWNEIVTKQLYSEKVTMTEEELKKEDWKITLGANNLK